MTSYIQIPIDLYRIIYSRGRAWCDTFYSTVAKVEYNSKHITIINKASKKRNKIRYRSLSPTNHARQKQGKAQTSGICR